MKKYAQLVILIVIFFGLVWVKQLRGSGDDQVAINSVAPTTSIATPTPTATPSSPTSTPLSNNDQPTSTPAPIDTPAPTPMPTTRGKYKDGTYTGSSADAYYGYIQVKANISGGKITSVQFLQYPNDNRTSQRINQQAMPYLQQEAIQAQSAQVDGVTGASDTSMAFQQSLSSALSQAT